MIIVAFIIPLFSSIIILSFLWPNQKTFFDRLLTKSFISVGFGLGVSSCIFFICLLLLHVMSRFFIFIETAVFAVLILLSAVYFYLRNRCNHIECAEKHVCSKQHAFQLWLFWGFWVACIFTIFFFVFRSVNRPHGWWDAWAIWNMRAKFIFRGGDRWQDAFSNIYAWSHPDYPLLLPGTVARIWNYVGSETTLAPIIVAFLFTFATVGLMVSFVSVHRSRSQGLIAGLFLMGLDSYILHGAGQQADIPMGYFILTVFILFFYQDRVRGKNVQLVFIAGMMAGLSAWTKNEGLLFVLSIVLSHSSIVFFKGFRVFMREAGAFFAGLFPVLFIIVYFKIALAPPNDLISLHEFKTFISRLTCFPRYLIVVREFITIFFQAVKGWIILPLAYAIVFGKSFDKEYKTGFFIASLTLSLMFIGYFIIYVISPHDLLWHLRHSLGRLYYQLLPSAITLFFFFVATPEEAAQRYHDRGNQ